MTAHAQGLGETGQDVTDVIVTPPRRSPQIYRNGAKRLLDLLFVILTAPFALPFVALLAAIVALDGHAPIFRQERLGRSGRVFRIWKLRSMVPDAEVRLSTHLAADPAAAVEWASSQKLRNDPRVTRFGRFLRKTSLDELPQLLNVMTGEMSLVGPRPMLVSQRDLYPGEDYYLLRPGITGAWQVSARNGSEFASRARYDAEYAQSLSLAEDLRILARTVAVVVRGTGC